MYFWRRWWVIIWYSATRVNEHDAATELRRDAPETDNDNNRSSSSSIYTNSNMSKQCSSAVNLDQWTNENGSSQSQDAVEQSTDRPIAQRKRFESVAGSKSTYIGSVTFVSMSRLLRTEKWFEYKTRLWDRAPCSSNNWLMCAFKWVSVAMT